MAEINSFKGIRYNPEFIKEFEKVITQPYDKIDSKLQDDYYQRSPYNYVRVILGKDEIEGRERKYIKAREYIYDWLNKGILIQDQKESIYPYIQEYVINGIKKTRFSFIATLKVSDYNEGIVIPHENTLSGPKKDRTNLLETTKKHTELIFMLYEDKKDIIKTLMDNIISQEPIIKMVDDDGTINTLFKISEIDIIKNIQNEMKDKKVYIADGHHRYETSLNYAKANRSNKLAQYTLCSFINMADRDGITIFPTHRVVKNISSFSKTDLLKNLEENFIITKQKSLNDLNNELIKSEKAFGLCFKNEFYLIKLKDINIPLVKIKDNVSNAYKLLDVAILHKLILEDILGIDKQKLEQKLNLDYVRGYENAYSLLENNSEMQCVFLLNPTKISELSEIAGNGDKMPQKSTDFYPKLLSGFVMYDFET